jgi:hypothetical protein
MTKIIAFAGRKQSGKTTCSSFLQDVIVSNNLGSCKVYNFADSLKQDICINMLGLTYEQCYGDDNHKNSLTQIEWKNIPGYNISWTFSKDHDESGRMTARQVMQFIGTEIFRNIKNDIWAVSTINKIRTENPDYAIIADCRFPNEKDIVSNNNGIVIKLTRNPFNSDHASEIAFDENVYNQKSFDLIINNSKISIEEQNKLLLDFLKNKGALSL